MSQPGVHGAPVASPVALESRWALSSLKPFAKWFKLLMFFAGSNGQVRTRTVRQSARGGGTPCPALIDYRWCGSARNCKAGYFKWWSPTTKTIQMPHFGFHSTVKGHQSIGYIWQLGVHMTLNDTHWRVRYDNVIAGHPLDMLMIPKWYLNPEIISMSKWYKVGQQVMVYACACSLQNLKCKSKKRGWK